MEINVPNTIAEQVQALIKKEEKKQERAEANKNIPYWNIIVTGEQDSGGHENLDKIKFPALVSYPYCGVERIGFITRANQYYLWDCTRQWDGNLQGEPVDTIQELWERWNFRVLKAKVIGKR